MVDAAINIPNWISLNDVCNLFNISEKTVKNKCCNSEFNFKIEKKNNKHLYFINFKSLPKYYQNKYLYGENTYTPTSAYSNAPVWAKAQVEKYLPIIKATEFLKGKDLMQFIDNWNIEHPDYQTSYPCLMKMKKRYKDNGIAGLLSNYGVKKNLSKISNEYFDYFKNLFLKEGSPSLHSCWAMTLGYAIRQDSSINKLNFPCDRTFLRKLERELSKQAIFLARKGQSAWNRRYNNYIERDYSTITCGKVWVSDHAQIDVACEVDGNVVFPWVTAWRDFKSGKWLGWYLQAKTPNSDHIFQTFYSAAQEYGLPEDVIIDNGKDYRCKDFAGGRVRISADEGATTAMLDELNVKVNFALPYNAQTKPIERDFRNLKEFLSKHCVGYRGGNVVERPEILTEEIKQGKIMSFDRFKNVFDKYVVDVMNKRPSDGKNLKGRCPDDLFDEEFKEKVVVSNEALKLFCTRTSRNFTIGRNGIQDRQLGITYWSDWMINKKGTKVYLRRDPKNYKEAWAFNVDNDEFVGVAKAIDAVAALHADEISKEEFKTAMANKKRNLKLTKQYIQTSREISIEEKYENLKAAYSSPKKHNKNTQITKIANTKMDEAVRLKKEMEQCGKQDLKGLLAVSKPKEERTIYLFATDKKLAERKKQQEKGVVVNG